MRAHVVALVLDGEEVCFIYQLLNSILMTTRICNELSATIYKFMPRCLWVKIYILSKLFLICLRFGISHGASSRACVITLGLL